MEDKIDIEKVVQYWKTSSNQNHDFNHMNPFALEIEKTGLEINLSDV